MISISAEAYRAFTGGPPAPSERDARGGYPLTLHPHDARSPLGNARPWRELQRRDPAAGEGGVKTERKTGELLRGMAEHGQRAASSSRGSRWLASPKGEEAARTISLKRSGFSVLAARRDLGAPSTDLRSPAPSASCEI
jgi:hypothetical protein